MAEPQPTLGISDTARAVAIARAIESERPDALFRDPFARRLAGPVGARMEPRIRRYFSGLGLPFRTLFFDDIVRRAVAEGVDTVINLAAGLDARPYRMAELPASLRWIEVDLPALVQEKDALLASEAPRCRLERIGMDLADGDSRRALFERLGRESQRALVLTEGLLPYLTAPMVEALARELAARPCFRLWGLDLIGPFITRLLAPLMRRRLKDGSALRFAPPEGADYFAPLGWRTVEVRSPLHAAARAGRTGLLLRLYARLPPSPRPGGRPWYGICLLDRIRS